MCWLQDSFPFSNLHCHLLSQLTIKISCSASPCFPHQELLWSTKNKAGGRPEALHPSVPSLLWEGARGSYPYSEVLPGLDGPLSSCMLHFTSCHSLRHTGAAFLQQDVHPNFSDGSSSLPSCPSFMGPLAAALSSPHPAWFGEQWHCTYHAFLFIYFLSLLLFIDLQLVPIEHKSHESRALVMLLTAACPYLAQCLAHEGKDRARPSEKPSLRHISCPTEQVWCSRAWRGLGCTAKGAKWRGMR